MPKAEDTRPDPFFIGDHLALDFLNSIATPQREPVEWLANGDDLLNWLERAGVINAARSASFRADPKTAAKLDRVAGDARHLREWFRSLLLSHAGAPLTALPLEALAPLNERLARDQSFHQIISSPKSDSGHAAPALVWVEQRHWNAPDILLQPIAQAMGELICLSDATLIKSCEGPSCTLMFYDRTKGHARRWCSMGACGNRAKAAAHRARRRKEMQGQH